MLVLDTNSWTTRSAARRRLPRVVALLALTLGVTSCGDEPSPQPTPTPTAAVRTLAFVYTANSLSGDVSALALHSDGALTAVPGSPFRTGGYPHELAVDPRGRHLYVLRSETGGAWSANHVAAFAIGADGGLTPVPGSPFAVRPNGSALAMHPSRDVLYLTLYERLGLYAYGIEPSGALSSLPFSPIDAWTDIVRDVAIRPSGDFLYLASADAIMAFKIAANGRPTRIGGWPLPAGLQTTLALDPQGRFLFAQMADYSQPETQTGVRVYAIGSDGGLTLVTGHLLPEEDTLTDAAVDPAGQWLYVSDHGRSRIVGMRIGSGGELTPLPGSPYPTGFMPMSVAIDPSGRFLCDANRASDNVYCHPIGSDGSLAAGTPVAVGSYPQAIAMAAPAQ